MDTPPPSSQLDLEKRIAVLEKRLRHEHELNDWRYRDILRRIERVVLFVRYVDDVMIEIERKVYPKAKVCYEAIFGIFKNIGTDCTVHLDTRLWKRTKSK